MPVTDDEMYRQFSADYFHHLQWREKLFGGFFVLIGALVAAYYGVYKNNEPNSIWRIVIMVIPLTGFLLSVID